MPNNVSSVTFVPGITSAFAVPAYAGISPTVRGVSSSIHIFTAQGAADRDPNQFSNPELLDFSRSPSPHLAFGRGIHFCVGARLARLEVRVILEELLARTRSFSLDPQRSPEYVSSILVRRHAELALITKS